MAAIKSSGGVDILGLDGTGHEHTWGTGLTGTYSAIVGSQVLSATVQWDVYQRTKDPLAIGLVGLISRKPDLYAWSRALGRTGLLHRATGSGPMAIFLLRTQRTRCSLPMM